MDLANYHPPMLRSLVAQRAFAERPFVLVDVGCAGGIDKLWRVFGDQLVGVGFDPQQSEIGRLRQSEDNPNVKYVASLVGLSEDHEFHRRSREGVSPAAGYFDALGRSSAAAMWRRNTKQQTNVIHENETREKVSIADYVRANGVGNIDFIKVDTDGHDLEVLLSAADIVKPCGVLGFLVETQFTGSQDDTANSYHNIDRLMRRLGFLPYAMGLRHYSREALPARFLYNFPAQTVSGPLFWADTLFLRDGASPQYLQVWGEELDTVAVLKLAGLYELFRLPDCAAELLLAHRARIATRVAVDPLLDLLTPPLDGEKVSYADYVEAFRSDPQRFYPRAVPGKQAVTGLLERIRRAVRR